jgi:hypothetical protein
MFSAMTCWLQKDMVKLSVGESVLGLRKRFSIESMKKATTERRMNSILMSDGMEEFLTVALDWE